MKKYSVFIKFFDTEKYKMVKDVIKIELNPPVLKLFKSEKDEYVFSWNNILYYNSVEEDKK